MSASLILNDLAPDPCDEWSRLLAFVGWSDTDRRVAARSVECLLSHSHDLVRGAYDHLMQVPETAAILGAGRPDVGEHLAERRAFLAVWIARTLGMDTSDEFALHLFRAGQLHAGLGPRRVRVPRAYIVGTIGIVLSAFANYLAEDRQPPEVLGPALGVWSRFLSVQLELLLLGHDAGYRLTSGPLGVRCKAYGRIRDLIGAPELALGLSPESRVKDVLRSVFAAYPAVRAEVLDRVWDETVPLDSSANGSSGVTALYVPKPGWRLLLNGRDVRYGGGLTLPITDGDEVAIFPPGR